MFIIIFILSVIIWTCRLIIKSLTVWTKSMNEEWRPSVKFIQIKLVLKTDSNLNNVDFIWYAGSIFWSRKMFEGIQYHVFHFGENLSGKCIFEANWTRDTELLQTLFRFKISTLAYQTKLTLFRSLVRLWCSKGKVIMKKI